MIFHISYETVIFFLMLIVVIFAFYSKIVNESEATILASVTGILFFSLVSHCFPLLALVFAVIQMAGWLAGAILETQVIHLAG